MKQVLVIAALLAATPAFAHEFSVTDQEQVALQTICDIASVSTTVTREVRSQIAGFCVAWEKRVATAKAADVTDANATPAAKSPEPEKKK
jgi:hypothetical protein